MNWQESDHRRRAGDALSSASGFFAAGRHPMKKPSGISGGAAWSWRKPAPDELWVPSTALRVVGVPHEFTNGRQLAVPIWRWRDWLLTHLGLVG